MTFTIDPETGSKKWQVYRDNRQEYEGRSEKGAREFIRGRKLEEEVQKAETPRKITNIGYLGTFIITHLEGAQKTDAGRIDEFKKIFYWIKNTFDTEGIHYEG